MNTSGEMSPEQVLYCQVSRVPEQLDFTCDLDTLDFLPLLLDGGAPELSVIGHCIGSCGSCEEYLLPTSMQMILLNAGIGFDIFIFKEFLRYLLGIGECCGIKYRSIINTNIRIDWSFGQG